MADEASGAQDSLSWDEAGRGASVEAMVLVSPGICMKMKGLLVSLALFGVVVDCMADQSGDVAEIIVRSIQKDVYERHFQHYYMDIGGDEGQGVHRVPLYISPEVATGKGWVIYKFMPYGEVMRMVEIRRGTAVLHGDPRNGFPPTQPDYLTVYMDDDKLCGLKKSWRRTTFSIDVNATEGRPVPGGSAHRERDK